MTRQELKQLLQDLGLDSWVTLSYVQLNNTISLLPTSTYNKMTGSDLKETTILLPIDLTRSKKNITAQLKNLRDNIKQQAFGVMSGGKSEEQPTVFHYPTKDKESLIVPKTIQQKAVVFMLNQANNIAQKLIEKVQKRKTEGFIINVLITKDQTFRLDIITAETHGVNLVRLKDSKNLPIVSLPIKLQDIVNNKQAIDLVKDIQTKCHTFNDQLIANDAKTETITVKRVVKPFPGQTLAHFLKENYEYSTFSKRFVQAFVKKKAADTPVASSLFNDYALLSTDERKAYVTGVAATIYSQAEDKPATDFIENQGRWFINSCLNSIEIPKA